jgi:hypothetical protein
MTNWDLSGTFMPYDGLFLPYEEEWVNLGPINGGLAQYNVSYAMMDRYYEKIQQKGTVSVTGYSQAVLCTALYLPSADSFTPPLLYHSFTTPSPLLHPSFTTPSPLLHHSFTTGFHSLSYFDIGNWGTRINVPGLLERVRQEAEGSDSTNASAPKTTLRAASAVNVNSSASKSTAGCGVRPNGMPGPCWAPEQTASSDFLEQYLMKALFQKGWSLRRGFVNTHKLDWVGTTDMDSMEPYFEDLVSGLQVQ